MAQTKLTCRCGWVFFVEGQGPAGCPHCGDPVELAAAPPPRPASPPVVLLGVAAVVLISGLAAGFALSSRSAPPRRDTVVRSTPSAGAPLPLPAQDPSRGLDAALRRQNLLAVAAVFLAGRATEFAERLADGGLEIRALAEKAARPVPEHVRAGDILVGHPPLEAVRTLKAGEVWALVVKRGAERLEIRAEFAEIGPEVRAILETYGPMLVDRVAVEPPVQAPADPPPVAVVPPPTPPKPEPLPETLVRALREKLLSMDSYYRGYFSRPEWERVEALLKAGKGMAEDIAFLAERALGEVWIAIGDDMAFIRSQAVEAEAKAKLAGAAGNDVVVKMDGATLDGRLLSETESELKIEVTRGQVKGIVVVARADVKEIRRGVGAASALGAKLVEAKAKPDVLLELAKSCRASGLTAHRDWICWLLLESEPANEYARMAMGYAKNDAGVWTREREIRADMIDYDGRSYTPEDFRRMLTSRGYVELEGRWFARKAWDLRATNLYRDETKLPMALENAVVTDRIRLETDRDGKVKKTTLGRMVGVLGEEKTSTETGFTVRRGVVTIVIEATADFIDCRLKATAEVTGTGGVIRAWVDNGAGGTKELYKIESIKKVDQVFDVTDVARGHRKITLHVEMSSPWISADNGVVMFLPCTRNDTGVFDVSAQVAEPLKAVNAALEKKK